MWRYCRNNNPTLQMRALICGVDATLARHVSITKCKMPNMRQNLHKFMRLLKVCLRKTSVKRAEKGLLSLASERRAA